MIKRLWCKIWGHDTHSFTTNCHKECRIALYFCKKCLEGNWVVLNENRKRRFQDSPLIKEIIECLKKFSPRVNTEDQDKILEVLCKIYRHEPEKLCYSIKAVGD